MPRCNGPSFANDRTRVRAVRVASVVASLLVGAGIATAGVQENVDPNDVGDQFAWSENAGWINAEPTAGGSHGLHVPPEGEVRGWLWSENVGWINTNCLNLASCGKVDFRVTTLPHPNDATLISLRGYGWGENIGWVSFSCFNTGSCAAVDYGVHIDRATGFATGFAWSENIGWISFSCLSTQTCHKQDFGVGVTPAPLGDAIFSDGFEK